MSHRHFRREGRRCPPGRYGQAEGIMGSPNAVGSQPRSPQIAMTRVGAVLGLILAAMLALLFWELWPSKTPIQPAEASAGGTSLPRGGLLHGPGTAPPPQQFPSGKSAEKNFVAEQLKRDLESPEEATRRRSEERRVGKECRSGRTQGHRKRK